MEVFIQDARYRMWHDAGLFWGWESFYIFLRLVALFWEESGYEL